MQAKTISRNLSLLILLFILGCQNPETPKEEENNKEDLGAEYTAEMNEKGNKEISIDDLEKNMEQNDENLEDIMQEMESEMEVDE